MYKPDGMSSMNPYYDNVRATKEGISAAGQVTSSVGDWEKTQADVERQQMNAEAEKEEKLKAIIDRILQFAQALINEILKQSSDTAAASARLAQQVSSAG